MSVLRHIVLFKFDLKKQKEIDSAIEEIKSLPSKIPLFLSFDIAAQNNHVHEGYADRSHGYTHVLDSTFKNSTDLKNYLVHPVHVRLVHDFIQPLLLGENPLLVVDYYQVEVKTGGYLGAVRHLVFLQIDPKKAKYFETEGLPQIIQLQQKIPNILTLRTGVRIPGYDDQKDLTYGRNFILDMTFASPAALKIYQEHPEHQRIIENYGKPSSAGPLIAIDWIPGAQKKVIRPTRSGAPIAPYSPAIRVGNIVYVSGCIGMDEKGDLVSSDIGGQTVKTLENLKAVVEEAGGTLADVVKATVLLKDITDGPKVNEIYGKYFPINHPARAAYAVAGLPKGALIEIECVVSLPIKSCL